MLQVKDIILLLEFCLKNAYISLQGHFYEQVEGAAMGSLASPIMANLYMDYFEQKALSTATHPLNFGSGMWMMHLSSKREDLKQNFLEHINSINLAIRFTVGRQQGG